MAHGRRLETTSRPYAPEDADALRGALARVVASEPFRNAPRLVSFLSFIVERTIAGEAGGLKGYTIATQALGRPDDFDPQADPIVRVEAGRLRRALQTYYEGEGAGDALRIVVPVGGYVPLLVEREGAVPEPPAPEPPPNASPPEAPPPLPPEPVRSRFPGGGRAWIAAGAAAAVGALLFGWFVAGPPAPPDAPGAPDSALAEREDGRPILVVQPMRNAGKAPERFSPSLLRGKVAEALARFDGLVVVYREQEDAPPARPHYDLRLRASRDGAHVSVRLTHRPSGELVWTSEIDVAEAAASGAPERELGRSIAVTVGQPFGVLFSDMRARVQRRPLPDPRP